MKIPHRIWINPEYGKPWTGTVLRTYNNDTIAIIHPDDQPESETRMVDIESEGWSSLDKNLTIPDDITSKEDYLFYEAIAKEFNK